MSEIIAPEQEKQVGFPWDTELVYGVEPDILGELGEAAQTTYLKKNVQYQHEIHNVLLQGKESQFFTPEEQEVIRQIDILFHRLVTATLPEDREEIKRELASLDEQTTSAHLLQITDTSGWFPRTHEKAEYNMLYSNEVISLVNAHISLLKEVYSGKALQAQLAKFFISLEGMPHFQQTSHRKEKETIADDFNVESTVLDIKGSLLVLRYLSEYESEEMFDQAKQDLASLIGMVRLRLEKSPSHLKEFNDTLHTILEGRRAQGIELRYKGTETKEAVAKRNAEVKRKLIENKITPVLCNTEEYLVYMHRTGEESARRICQTGFATGDTLEGTATVSATDQERAMDVFLQRHRNDSAVVLIRVPRSLQKKIDDIETLPREQWGSLAGDNSTAVIPPSWIVGYVRRSDTELVKNDHFQDKNYDAVKPPIGFTNALEENE